MVVLLRQRIRGVELGRRLPVTNRGSTGVVSGVGGCLFFSTDIRKGIEENDIVLWR